jgi:RNA polymerase sigma factor (TIGR02999 family)
VSADHDEGDEGETPAAARDASEAPEAKGNSDWLAGWVYDELRAVAAHYLKAERPDHTLRPTALVHEAWLRMAQNRSRFEDQAHYLSIAAQAMRRVLADHSRRRRAEKRGGGALRVELADDSRTAAAGSLDVLDLSEALDALAREDAELARLVELRYFGGLSVEETAQVLGKSVRQVEGAWAAARGFLYRSLGPSATHGG